ncbi:MAG: hypothetical protein P8X55_18025, partial [Desulfosarcinaceae bacterium]
CTMGFLFVTLAFCLPVNRKIAIGGASFGLLYGSLMGVTRAVQGAHFFTDALWSLGAVLVVALLLNDIVLPLVERSLIRSRALSRRRLWLYGACLAVLAAAIAAAFLTRRPYVNHSHLNFQVPASARKVVIRSEFDFTREVIRYSDPPAKLSVLAQGFGWFNANEQIKFRPSYTDGCLTIVITATPHSYFSELHHEISLRLPQAFKDHIAVEILPETAVDKQHGLDR